MKMWYIFFAAERISKYFISFRDLFSKIITIESWTELVSFVYAKFKKNHSHCLPLTLKILYTVYIKKENHISSPFLDLIPMQFSVSGLPLISGPRPAADMIHIQRFDCIINKYHNSYEWTRNCCWKTILILKKLLE